MVSTIHTKIKATQKVQRCSKKKRSGVGTPLNVCNSRIRRVESAAVKVHPLVICEIVILDECNLHVILDEYVSYRLSKCDHVFYGTPCIFMLLPS